jgi:hypothetical protein
MITIRAHGLIDWALAALMGAGSTSRSLSPSVQYQDKTADGSESRFFKFVRRED